MKYDVYEYIRSYFQRRFPEYYLLFKNERINYVDKTYIDMIKEMIVEKYDSQDIINGRKDEEIHLVLNNYVNKYFSLQQRKEYIKLYRYSYNLLKDYDTNRRFSLDIYDHIVKKVVVKIWSMYGGVRLDIPNFKDNLMSEYDKTCKEVRRNVFEKVIAAINPNLNISDITTSKINDSEMKKYVVSLILINERRDFLRELDFMIAQMDDSIPLSNDKMEQYLDNSRVWKTIKKYIKQYVDKISSEKDKDNKVSSTIQYIVNYIKNNVDAHCSIPDVHGAAFEIDKYFRKQGLNSEDIMLPENQEIIKIRYMRYVMKRNSVVRTDAPKRTEKRGKKRRISDVLLSLLIISSLIGGGALMGLGLYKYSSDNFARKEVEAFDSYGYSYRAISSIYDSSLEPTANNVIVTFDDYSKFNNDNFKYLAFYRAFTTVDKVSYKDVVAETSVSGREDTYKVSVDQRLHIMDSLLDNIKETISKNDEYSDLYAEIRFDSCYLDFIYDRLEEMGFDKIRDDKYLDVLQEYKKEKKEHPYKNPLNYMSSRDINILEDVMDKYTKYSEQYLIELGVLLGEQKDAEIQGLSNDTGGPKI